MCRHCCWTSSERLQLIVWVICCHIVTVVDRATFVLFVHHSFHFICPCWTPIYPNGNTVYNLIDFLKMSYLFALSIVHFRFPVTNNRMSTAGSSVLFPLPGNQLARSGGSSPFPSEMGCTQPGCPNSLCRFCQCGHARASIYAQPLWAVLPTY